MNSRDRNLPDQHREEELQAAAERAERARQPHGDTPVDAYRLVLRALRQPLPHALPEDFAQQVARRVEALDASDGLERWLTNLLMASMAAAALWFALPMLATTMAQVLHAVGGEGLPWQPVCIAAAGVGVVWMLDRYVSSASGRSGSATGRH